MDKMRGYGERGVVDIVGGVSHHDGLVDVEVKNQTARLAASCSYRGGCSVHILFFKIIN